MLLHLAEKLADVTVAPALDIRAEAHRHLIGALLDYLVKPVKRAAADKEDIRRIDMDEFLMRVLASALRRDIRYRSLEELEQRLLHALAGDVARN